MHATLHLTSGCNFDCAYCYSPPRIRHDMDSGLLRQAIDYVARTFPPNTGLIYFGGEPLLRKDLIREAVAHVEGIHQETGWYAHHKLTTNGSLLDESFVAWAREHSVEIALSLDGVKASHDKFRRFRTGGPSFDLLQPKIDLLLESQPYAKALMTVGPATLDHYAESFSWLVERGFRYVVASLDYSADWTDTDVARLEKQYRRIAKLYERYIREERKFYFSPFEMKLATHIKQDRIECYQCHLGKRQISISPQGDIYPCSQFVKDGVSNTDWRIGNVVEGIDAAVQEKLYLQSRQAEAACLSCAYLPRCNNKCACQNWQLTGTVNGISPKLCECERVLFPIVDELGAKLFEESRAMFVQKHYNSVYPILSMMEDRM